MWLKEDVVLKTHDNWRFNDRVSIHSTVADTKADRRAGYRSLS